jgi:hypothetical protein
MRIAWRAKPGWRAHPPAPRLVPHDAEAARARGDVRSWPIMS